MENHCDLPAQQQMEKPENAPTPLQLIQHSNVVLPVSIPPLPIFAQYQVSIIYTVAPMVLIAKIVSMITAIALVQVEIVREIPHQLIPVKINLISIRPALKTIKVECVLVELVVPPAI